VSLPLLFADLASIRFGRTGTTTLADADGMVLTTGEPKRREAGTLRSTELLSAVRGNRSAVVSTYSPVTERRELAAVAPVGTLSWSVVTTQAASEAFAPVDEVGRSLWAVLLTATLTGAAFAWWLAGLIHGTNLHAVAA